ARRARACRTSGGTGPERRLGAATVRRAYRLGLNTVGAPPGAGGAPTGSADAGEAPFLVEVEHLRRRVDRHARGAQDLARRPREDAQIEPEGPVENVADVEFQALGPGQVVAAVDLREPGDARPDLETLALPVGVP